MPRKQDNPSHIQSNCTNNKNKNRKNIIVKSTKTLLKYNDKDDFKLKLGQPLTRCRRALVDKNNVVSSAR